MSEACCEEQCDRLERVGVKRSSLFCAVLFKHLSRWVVRVSPAWGLLVLLAGTLVSCFW